ncbi:hypothetical protein B0H10DRAFT_2027655 [Mycena sp. CBHHK59/15]|nr:hypothetical protein B0H10DRAFT_2237838 [Mycena sp. CBHHK59/15]KAJ6602971.1 hypothetical protein B0H10DRAFT_2080095 [Mycena sp. CBHHK59/15]KAJ6619090.1 hypothetical protein B0H10DRAFT_2027655 [Mycena sp. CBHHK59/15]
MLFANTSVSTNVQEAAAGSKDAAHASGAFTVPIDANTEESTIPVNQADRCSVCQQWIPTKGGVHNCPGNGK